MQRRRGLIGRLFTADANHDGVVTGEEWTVFIAARSLLVVSIGFATWGWGTEIIGRAIVDNAGDFWLLKLGAWIVGFILGGVVGATASVLTAFGFNFTFRAFKQGRWGVGVVIGVGSSAGAAAVFLGMFFMFAGMLDGSWARYQGAKDADLAIARAVEAGRDSTLIEEERQAAIDDYQRALDDRTRALGWQDTVIACVQAGGGPCEAVKPIQVVLGIRDDGMVRGATACANCGETAAAIDAYLNEAESRLVSAQQRRDERTAELAVIRAYESGHGEGSAAGDLAAASNVEKLKAFVKGFIGTARTTYQLQSWVSGDLHPALAKTDDGASTPEALDMIEERAFALGTVSAIGGALLLDFFSIVANVVLGLMASKQSVRRRPDEALPALPPPDDEPPPSDTQVIVTASGARIAARAPLNPQHETPTEGRIRLERAIAEMQALQAAEDDSFSAQKAKIIEDHNQQLRTKGQDRELEALRRQLDEARAASAVEMPPLRRPPQPEPEVARRATAELSIDRLEAMIDAQLARAEELRAEQKAAGQGTVRWGLCEDELHGLHAEIQRLETLIRSKQRAQA